LICANSFGESTYIRHGYMMAPQRAERGGRLKNRADAPLTPAVLHILLALSTEERHGYGIMKQVEQESRGKVKMGPGTLYGSIGRMMAAGLIHESDRKIDPAMDDERRIYYRLTAAGRKALAAELDRYRDVVAVATEKQVFPIAIADGV
jgi:DNA-binding PadR family transcriptional regulator